MATIERLNNEIRLSELWVKDCVLDMEAIRELLFKERFGEKVNQPVLPDRPVDPTRTNS